MARSAIIRASKRFMPRKVTPVCGEECTFATARRLVLLSAAKLASTRRRIFSDLSINERFSAIKDEGRRRLSTSQNFEGRNIMELTINNCFVQPKESHCVVIED